MSKKSFKTYSGQKIMYIFRINDDLHKDLLKIGEATNHGKDINDYQEENTEQLNGDAIGRIGQETITAGIPFDLLYTTISMTKNKESFMDKDVHRVLKVSGIKQVLLKNEAGTATEWFKCDLQTAINAIKAVKEGRHTLKNEEKSINKTPIILREEQKRFVKETINSFKKSKTHLWDAKMRFGKTVTALTVAKEMGSKKTLIYTHRPVVNAGWFEDYSKVFYEDNNTVNYGSHSGNGLTIDKLIEDYDKFQTPFIYFASLQDLRGKDGEDWKDRNKLVFDTEWDLVIIDEVHEGTRTDLGRAVYDEVNKDKTKILSLSGTPFNVMQDFKEENTSTWDYIMEQEAKANWDYEKGPNPYTCPKMNIFTYDLSKAGDTISQFCNIGEHSFNFREFFRTYVGKAELDGKIVDEKEKGKFVHEKEINNFLDLLTNISEESNYPYSTEEYRKMFNHTLWMIPGVKEAKALSELLQNHKVFSNFKIVNVAGPGDEDVENEEALKMVKNAIKSSPYTITLSCGKLTTGVTVPEWNAVLYMSGSKNTGAQNYLQTIFRVQSPCQINGKVKENCYVFDFAPDRVLTIVPEVSSITSHNRYSFNNQEKREHLQKVLNFLPVISISGSATVEYDVESMMGEIKKATAQKVALEGFDDDGLYNLNKLLTLTKVDITKFNGLQQIVGKSTKEPTKQITINAQGLTETKLQNLSNKPPKTPLTPEQEKERKALLEAQKQRNTAISILRGISVRIPLLVYGLDSDKDEDLDITIDNFTSLVDDESFEEFMPKGVDKKKFDEFKEFYDRDVFRQACKNIRQRVKDADKLPILERIYEIADIFATFRNPDKETVLTPWRVVNKHLQFSLGGYNLYNEEDVLTHRFPEPPFKDNGDITKETLLNLDSHILDINSKTGLYSLYVCYSIFRERLAQYKGDITPEKLEEFWYNTIEKNIFALCKTKMAKSITLRTLCGFNVTRDKSGFHIKDYSGVKNFKYVNDYISNAKDNKDKLIELLLDDNTWDSKEDIELKIENKENKTETKEKTKRETNSHFKFSMIGYKVGDKITLTDSDNNKYEVKIIDDTHIEYQGNKTSLSTLAMDLYEKKTGIRRPISGPEYFSISQTIAQMRRNKKDK